MRPEKELTIEVRNKEHDYGWVQTMRPDDDRQERWKAEKAERGWDSTELWNLDSTFSYFILPRIKALRDSKIGHPASLTQKQWDTILNKMIYSFEFYAGEEKFSCSDERIWKKVNNGMRLFGVWYGAMWD